MKTKETQVGTGYQEIVLEEQAVAIPTPVGLDEISVEGVAAIVARQNEILRIALEATSQNDWTAWPRKDMNKKEIGHRWEIGRTGAMKLARLFGISIRNMVDGVDVEEGTGHFVVRYRADFTCWGRTVVGEGLYSSRDKMLGNENAALVNRADICKAAYSNCLKHGIADILGIGAFDSAVIEAHALKKGWNANKMEFVDGAQGGQAKPNDDKKLIVEIARIMMDTANGDAVIAAREFERITAWTDKSGKVVPGMKSIKALEGASSKQVFKIHKIVEAYGKAQQPPGS